MTFWFGSSTSAVLCCLPLFITSMVHFPIPIPFQYLDCMFSQFVIGSLILLRFWQTRHQLYVHLPPITKTIQVRWTRHAGHCWRRRDELISDALLWTPHMAEQKQDDQYEHKFRNYVRIRDVILKTCQGRWMIGKVAREGQGYSCYQHDMMMMMMMMMMIILWLIFFPAINRVWIYRMV